MAKGKSKILRTKSQVIQLNADRRILEAFKKVCAPKDTKADSDLKAEKCGSASETQPLSG